MDGKEEYYNLILCSENGYPMMFNTRSDEDLLEKYLKCRENKFAYFQWNHGIAPMRHVIGIMKQ